MKNHAATASLLAAMAMLACGDAALTQGASSEPPAASNVAVPFQMSMGDMMNTLVQPRHAKLGIAGHDENWPLAAYAAREIRQSFAAIGKAIPRWRGLPVPSFIEAAVSEPLKAIDLAIKQRDAQQFAAAFDKLNQGCNACHATADHPFVVIKTPDASSFPNQDFRARQ